MRRLRDVIARRRPVAPAEPDVQVQDEEWVRTISGLVKPGEEAETADIPTELPAAAEQVIPKAVPAGPANSEPAERVERVYRVRPTASPAPLKASVPEDVAEEEPEGGWPTMLAPAGENRPAVTDANTGSAVVETVSETTETEVEAALPVEIVETPEPAPQRRKIWDIDPSAAPATSSAMPDPETADESSGVETPQAPAPHSNSEPSPAPVAPAAVPASAARSGRVKTRLLGFHTEELAQDVFAAKADAPAPVSTAAQFPTGWLVVVEGPGRGAGFALTTGVSTIGRGDEQTIQLDFGDSSVSRDNHAAVAYDDEENKFFIGHGGKSNIVRLNGRPVLSTEELHNADLIRIGKTVLRFVALCGSDFSWKQDDSEDTQHAADD